MQIGLLYDNLIVGYGRFIGDGSLLKLLSQPRFFVHEVILVTLIFVVDYIGRLAGCIQDSSVSSCFLWCVCIQEYNREEREGGEGIRFFLFEIKVDLCVQERKEEQEHFEVELAR